ncbi:MAG: hypothetical protein OCC46_09635 [Pseudodesulfovibrio sp.]
MKIAVLILSLTLLASPCLAGIYPDLDGGVLVASAQNKKKEHPESGKVVIKGKGGKVTDVDKKPKKDGKKK